MRQFLLILLTVTVASTTPLERKDDGPMVVDIPASMFAEDEVDDAIPADKTVPVAVQSVSPVVDPSSDEIDFKKVISDDGEDLGGFRVPTVFIIRRPSIPDRFPFFQSSPFFGSSSMFENRRPYFQRPTFQQLDRTPVVQDSSDHVMLTHVEQMMKRMQEQMSSLFGSFASPSLHRRPYRPVRPIFPSLSFGSEEDTSGSAENETLINIDNLPANYSNSTSETKVVNGHVVQVNKTIHKISSGGNNQGFFHFEVINVRPTEGAKTETDTPVGIDAGTETDSKPKVVEIPETIAQAQPVPDLPKAEDPSLNEVGESKPTQDNVSGVDAGLIVEEPKAQHV